MGQYADAFQRKGIGNTDQLDEIQLEVSTYGINLIDYVRV